MAKNQDFESMSKEITTSRAFKIEMRIEWIRNSFYIFDRNYLELKQLLLACDKPEVFMKFFGNEKQEENNLIMNEIRRRLHNFLAAAKTLIDHTRNNIKSIDNISLA